MRRSSRKSKSTSIRFRPIDFATGFLIYFSVAFAPLAFGTVTDWAIWTLNICGYLLGLLMFLKYLIRHYKKVPYPKVELPQVRTRESLLNTAVILFPAMTLMYILVHWVNARAAFDPSSLSFTYSERSISWLPHSFDKILTSEFFWKYLAFCSYFWAIRAWLKEGAARSLTKSQIDERSLDNAELKVGFILHRRLRNLLVAIVVVGASIALIGILQRLSDSSKLLWISEPVFRKNSEDHFGPFAYRGNGAAYLNLVIPLCLSLLAILRLDHLRSNPSGRIGSGPHNILYPVTLLLVAGVFLTASRAALIVLGLIAICLVLLLFATRLGVWIKSIAVICSIAAIALAFSGQIRGLERIKSTIQEGFNPTRDTRLDIYQHFPPMIKDHLLWGSGPGTFSSIYFMYRKPALQILTWRAEGRNNRLVTWAAWAHSDPVEFLITFGVPGFTLLTLSLIACCISPYYPLGSIRKSAPAAFVYLAIFGYIVHSLVDFPFQVYSLAHLFVVILAILSTLVDPRILSATNNGNPQERLTPP